VIPLAYKDKDFADKKWENLIIPVIGETQGLKIMMAMHGIEKHLSCRQP